MNIKIDDTYSIKSDLRNVMLIENKVVLEGKNKGKPVESVLGFYGSLEAALKAYLRTRINLSDATSVRMLLNEVKKVEETIHNVLNGI